MASILVALATYNEIENLPALVVAVHEKLPAANILVVDDHSPDGTGQWCSAFAQDNPWFSVQHRSGKLGLGTALAAAMQFSVERNYATLITLDADWSHPPDRLPALVEAAQSADVVIGSRYCAGGGIEGWPLRRRLASRLVNSLSRLLLGTPVSDCSGNYRAYGTSSLEQLDFDRLHAEGYAFIEEVLWHLHQLGATFAEVPIIFTDRRAGSSKINFREALGALKTLSRLAVKRLFSQS